MITLVRYNAKERFHNRLIPHSPPQYTHRHRVVVPAGVHFTNLAHSFIASQSHWLGAEHGTLALNIVERRLIDKATGYLGHVFISLLDCQRDLSWAMIRWLIVLRRLRAGGIEQSRSGVDLLLR